MHIGVIASMKRGLELFVYRELLAFSGEGHRISLFPTKLAPGLYNARPEWKLHAWHPLKVLLAQPAAFLGAPLRYLALLREALATRALVDFLLAWFWAPQLAEVDVIYATFGDHKLYVGYFAKQILGKPLAVTIHAYELYENPNPRLFTRALAACDQIITVTEYNRELLAEEFGVDPQAVQVVRIHVDTERYRPQEKFVVLIVAFFAERKGHETLFRAIQQLNRPEIEVWVVGDEGPESETVDVPGLARELGVDSQVAFFGRLGGTALEAVYHACDVFCLPSRTDSHGVAEGFPTVLAEAMAFGKPVITTRHVEIPRVVPRILVDENDVDGLAQAILTLYQDPALRREMGAENRRIAEQLFSTRNPAKTARLLQNLAEGAQRASQEGPETRKQGEVA